MEVVLQMIGVFALGLLVYLLYILFWGDQR